MVDFSKSRDFMLNSLISEVFGPELIMEPEGKGIDVSKDLQFSKDEINNISNPYYDVVNKQEILTSETPLNKYGCGVLYPVNHNETSDNEIKNNDQIDNFAIPNEADDHNPVSANAIKELNNIQSRKGSPGENSDIEFDLSGANTRFQSCLGISFFCKLEDNHKIVVESPDQPCGIYSKKDIYVEGKKESSKSWYVRNDYIFKYEFNASEINNIKERNYSKLEKYYNSSNNLNLDIKLLVRPIGEYKLITATLINKTDNDNPINEKCLFQSGFKVKIIDSNSVEQNNFYPYPKSDYEKLLIDEEEKVLDLIYRNNQTFAIGHGCAANWPNTNENCAYIEATCLPIYDSPNITPDIKIKNKKEELKTPMKILAGLENSNWEELLTNITSSYNEWINDRKNEIKLLAEEYKKAAEDNLKKCETALNRMNDGIEFIKNDHNALKAFQLTNEAILTQQIRSSIPKRQAYWDDEKHTVYFPDEYKEPDINLTSERKGNWRPFQIAFLLSSLKSSVDIKDEYRNDVELIFFPTGGGKTEAYLALSAFTSFYRRLINKDDDGVQVIMRYTLRLLTAQQFTRAASLICAMEKIREREINILGEKRFSIGVWLGQASTPNRNKGTDTNPGAINYYTWLMTGNNKKAVYNFLITKCPWCSSEIGQVSNKEKKYNFNKRSAPKVIGLHRNNNCVEFLCRNRDCTFNSTLPIYVVDEDVYEKRPTILIGTVDKFAQLTWEPKSKLLFGLNEDGERINSPPSLILQDELHLITGPLGSMCGLYEVVIEELCTENRNNEAIKPKIICSTATIRSYERQVKDLYNRNQVRLFPPLGLDIADNFFASYKKEEDSEKYKNPKKYIGLLTPNYKSQQTAQVRIYSRLLYSVTKLKKEDQDPWFTLMNFFGSLRELGNTTTLFQVDIKERIKDLRKRYGDDYKNIRTINNVLELTSRISSEKIPNSIDKLEISVDPDKKNYPIDICLASNIIEVGIDIDRLSLLTILGQPKTTSSYIQVSGRIGRNWQERPGIVCTLYGYMRPRDKSHFEKFKSYHQKLYAQVEPMSVTPFAYPVLKRALHGILVAYVRSFGNKNITMTPTPVPENLIIDFYEIIKSRIENIDNNEKINFEKIFSKILNEWKIWEHDNYKKEYGESSEGLMYQAGSYIDKEFDSYSWETPNTMRNIDKECIANITTQYMTQNDRELEDNG